MAKRRYVMDSFWSDPWVEDLDSLERYLYLYLLTNQYVSICWFYEIKERRMAFETWIDKEMIWKMIWRFQDAWKVFYNDDMLFIVNFVKNQNVKSEEDNLRKWIIREIKDIWQEKVDKTLSFKGAYKVVEGAYKDVPIPYLTLLNFTWPNSTLHLENEEDEDKEEKEELAEQEDKSYLCDADYEQCRVLWKKMSKLTESSPGKKWYWKECFLKKKIWISVSNMLLIIESYFKEAISVGQKTQHFSSWLNQKWYLEEYEEVWKCSPETIRAIKEKIAIEFEDDKERRILEIQKQIKDVYTKEQRKEAREFGKQKAERTGVYL